MPTIALLLNTNNLPTNPHSLLPFLNPAQNLLPPDPSMPITSIQTHTNTHTCDTFPISNHHAIVLVIPSLLSIILLFIAITSLLGLALGCLLGWIGKYLSQRKIVNYDVEAELQVGREKGPSVESSIEWVIGMH
jgi:hypothetical protein